LNKIAREFRKGITAFYRSPWDEKKLLYEAYYLLGWSRALLLMIPFRKLAPKLGQHNHETSFEMDWDSLEEFRKLKRAISRASRVAPWRTKCFEQAITGKIMLRRRKHPSTLYLGVCKDKVKGEGLKAHAWLRTGQYILTGREGMRQFTVVGVFGEK
jgi:hypothetical protein